jgi:hypothetical protein
MFKHLIVVRMKYSNDIKFIERNNVREKTFIHSILNQINKNFDLAFIINPNHQSIISKFFEKEPFNVLYFQSSEDVRDYCIKNDINIQTRIDDDDMFSSEYVDILQKIYINNIEMNDKFLIQTQPYKYLIDKNETYEMGLRYTESITSMFLTLCQSSVDKFIMDRPHNKMSEIVKNVISTNEGICSLVIHNTNNVSNLKKSDKKIEFKQVSIIIPTFKNVNYIDECLMSVINSSKNYNFEILVGIDNCDETTEFILKNQNKYPNTKFFVFNDSVGPYVIKNSLTQISNSNNLIFFDSDDIMGSDMVTKIMDNSDHYGSIRFNFYNFENIKNPYPNKGHAEGVFFIKKSYFNFLNGFEPWKCAADTEFHKRVIKNEINTNYLDEFLFLRRVHIESLTRNLNTGYNSNIRQTYVSIIKNKQKLQNFKPLSELVVHKFSEINDDNIKIISNFSNFNFFKELESDENLSKNNKPQQPHKLIPKDFNPNKPRTVIDSSITSPQNKPKGRNDVFQIKKESLVGLSKKIGIGKGKKSLNKLYL